MFLSTESDPADADFQSMYRQVLLRKMYWRQRLSRLAVGLQPSMRKPWWSMQGASLHNVIDDQLTSRHDELEPPLGIGEDTNILQRVPVNHEQVCIGSRSHHA